ncbi:MAG: sulfite exporter TauE/SafE family protein [Nanoarchaeota archaeon]
MVDIKRKFKIKGIDSEDLESLAAKEAFSVSGVKSIDFFPEKEEAQIEMEEDVNLSKVFEKMEKRGFNCETISTEKIIPLDTNNSIEAEPLPENKPPTESIIKKKFKVKNMVCASCEKIISKEVHKLSGIKSVIVDYNSGSAEISYDQHQVSFEEIKNKIESRGYIVTDSSELDEKKKLSGFSWLLIAAGIIMLGYFALQLYSNISIPEICKNMGYGLLFVVGLLTGFHCVAMCGGFVVSYTTKGAKEGKKPMQLHASYAIGKTISYTIIGAIFGLLGSIIAFTPAIRGWAGIIAGTFLILFGLKMLGLSWFKKFQFSLPKSMSKWIGEESKIHQQSPLIIGLLNGLMIACGPLQAVYIMAAGTGSMVEGAKMLFIFGLGTLPVMLGFGYLTSIISSKATMKILKASGVLVIILGLIMLNRGLALTGSGYDTESLTSGISALGSNNNVPTQTSDSSSGLVIKDGYQEIRMTVGSSGFSPNKFVLKKGVPVKWIITGAQLNGCNNKIQVPAYNLNFDVKPGEQTIEFTPDKVGTISWSCWMGMLRGAFVVTDSADAQTVAQAASQVQVPKGASCGAGGGGCGCGGGAK